MISHNITTQTPESAGSASRGKILITSGPTREYLDPVRFLTNGSSGRMGVALATAALECGFEPVVVSGPVQVSYPDSAVVTDVITTEQMLDAAMAEFPQCVGLISAAAVCDYRPVEYSQTKLSKTGSQISLLMESTADVLAELGRQKRSDQWSVGFALETNDGYEHALRKLRTKNCDLICLNGPQAIDAHRSELTILDSSGCVAIVEGSKSDLARKLFAVIQTRFYPPSFQDGNSGL